MDTMADNIFDWCGYKWRGDMNGRQIHPDFPWYWYSLNAINVCENGVLEFTIKKNPKEIKHWDGKIYNPEYEVATMRSVEDFGYGTFSAEIMLPSGVNLWPSFWLSGSGNWPPEIDILEAWSGDDKYFKWFIAQPPYLSPGWRTTTNVHYNNKNLEHKSVGSRNISWFKQSKNPSTNFIEYKCVWLPNEIIFYVGGREVRKVSGQACIDLVKNLKDPEKGYKMNAIFDIWFEDPKKNKTPLLKSPMRIRNFKYEPYTIYYIPR
jgi:beta-glucanase (GH16 family)